MRLSAASIFRDNMVLQRNKNVAVWGEAESGTEVTVEVNNVSVTVTVADNKWHAELPPMDASTGCRMRISTNENEEIILNDVAFGEVWIAGGQSNMEMAMYADADFEEALADANYSDIRFYDCPRVSYEGQFEEEDYSEFGFWRKLTKEDISYFTAAGHYFAKMLYKELGVPIGIVGCNWGGSPAAAWTDESYLTGELECYLKDNEEVLAEINMDEYIKEFKAERVRANSPEGKEAVRNMMKTPMLKPMKFDFPFDESKMRVHLNGPYSPFRASGLYHTMLKEIIPYTNAGVIWYQGEADTNRAEIYDKMFGEMIRCWRESWNDELPFVFVQLAPFESFAISNGTSFIPVRAMQDKVSKTVPNAHMACIMDVGMEYDIHPKQKKPVGERLALLALGKVYGQDILCESPEADTLTLKDGSLEVTFKHAGDGLSVNGTQINALELYIDGKQEEDFTTSVQDSVLTIISPLINENATVELRHAWVGYCEVNLYNSAGLPAKPFII